MANFVTLLSYLANKIQLMKEGKPNVKGMKKRILECKYPQIPFPPKQEEKHGIETYTVLDRAVYNCIFFQVYRIDIADLASVR